MAAALPAVTRASRPAGTAGRGQLPNCNCNCNILKKHQKILLFHKQKLIFVSLHKRKSLFCAFCTMPFFGLLRAFPGVLARCMASRSSAWQQGLSWRFYRPFLASWRAVWRPGPPPGSKAFPGAFIGLSWRPGVLADVHARRLALSSRIAGQVLSRRSSDQLAGAETATRDGNRPPGGIGSAAARDFLPPSAPQKIKKT